MPKIQINNLSSKTKMRMLLILLFGAVISAGIFAFGFFAMRQEVWNQAKQCRSSLDQINQLFTIYAHRANK